MQSTEYGWRQAGAGSDVVADVWQALTEMFGSAFVAAYGEEPPTLWRSAIESFTPSQLGIGLRRIAEEKREFPVNLTEFRAACIGSGPPRYLGVPQTPADVARRLSAPTASRDRIDETLRRMRETVANAEIATRRGAARVKPEEPSCTCEGLGECETCQAWARRMLEVRGRGAAGEG